MKMSEKIEKRASRVRKRNCADAVDYEALAKERAEAKRREKAKDPREWEMECETLQTLRRQDLKRHFFDPKD